CLYLCCSQGCLCIAKVFRAQAISHWAHRHTAWNCDTVPPALPRPSRLPESPATLLIRILGITPVVQYVGACGDYVWGLRAGRLVHSYWVDCAHTLTWHANHWTAYRTYLTQ